MATAQKLTDHFLTCTICHEVFTDPSTLACGHSFCGQCIVSFTKTKPDAISSESIPCPFCRRLTRVPDPSRPVEEWAGQMRPTLLLKGLLDTVGPGAKDTTNCTPCHEEGETKPAVSWCSVCDVSLCSNCLRAHRRIPATQHHDVSDMTDEVKVKRRLKVTCNEHREEFVKFFCRDCKRTLCQSCCILYHRKCESVVSLESMLPEMKSSLEARKEKLMENSREEDKQLESLKSRCEEIDETKSYARSKILSAAQRMFDTLTKKEKDLLEKLDEVTDKEIDKLKADIKTRDMASNIYRQQSELIDQAVNSESEMDMYDLYQSNESEAAESGEEKRGEGTWIEFTQDIDTMDRAMRELSLGEIQVFDQADFETMSSPVLRLTKELNGDYINDIVSMEIKGSDTIIVTDNKMCITSLYERNSKQYQSNLKMPSQPLRIAKLENNIAYVTLPYSKQIAVVSVTPDLILDSIITTQKEYIGLTVLTPTTLAAGSDSPPCVDILDMNGNVMHSISPIHNGQKVIKMPSHLCTTRQGNILISDKWTNSVVCVTPQGEVVFNYSPTGDGAHWNPQGITSTATGNILVTDFIQNKVIQLNEYGEFVRDILSSQVGIGPLGIDWDDIGKIYVTWLIDEDPYGIHHDVNIQVFALQTGMGR